MGEKALEMHLELVKLVTASVSHLYNCLVDGENNAVAAGTWDTLSATATAVRQCCQIGKIRLRFLN